MGIDAHRAGTDEPVEMFVRPIAENRLAARNHHVEIPERPQADVAAGQTIVDVHRFRNGAPPVGRPAAGEEPQLYFEVRRGRTPLDPADWLQSR